MLFFSFLPPFGDQNLIEHSKYSMYKSCICQVPENFVLNTPGTATCESFWIVYYLLSLYISKNHSCHSGFPLVVSIDNFIAIYRVNFAVCRIRKVRTQTVLPFSYFRRNRWSYSSFSAGICTNILTCVESCSAWYVPFQRGNDDLESIQIGSKLDKCFGQMLCSLPRT